MVTPTTTNGSSVVSPSLRFHLAVELADLDVIAAMARVDGPFASVLLPSPVAGWSGDDIGTEWGSARHGLTLGGAEPVLVHFLERFMNDVVPRGQPLYLVASGRSLGWRWLRNRDLTPPRFAVVGRLPVLAPLIDDLSYRRPVIGAVIDRTGADVLVQARSGEVKSESVRCDRAFIHRVASGGWSQRRRQARTDVTLRRNAVDIAAHIGSTAARVGADHVVLTGDEREVLLVRHHLGSRAVDVVAAGGRNEPATTARLIEAMADVVAKVRAAERQVAFCRFSEELGQADRAVGGPVATLEGLSAGSVETLLVAHDLADDRRAWFGAAAASVSMFASALSTVAGRGRLDDVAIRAALHIGAAVEIVRPGDDVSLPQGIGALLRHPSASGAGGQPGGRA